MMLQWWVRRSSRAVVILASPKTWTHLVLAVTATVARPGQGRPGSPLAAGDTIFQDLQSAIAAENRKRAPELGAMEQLQQQIRQLAAALGKAAKESEAAASGIAQLQKMEQKLQQPWLQWRDRLLIGL